MRSTFKGLLEGWEFSLYLLIEDLLEEMGGAEEAISRLASPEVQSLIAEGRFKEEGVVE